METRAVTHTDLEKFKTEIIQEILMAMKKQPAQDRKPYLKTYQVIELLGISKGKLQTMRDDGSIPFTQLGGVILYDREDILELLKSNKHALHGNDRRRKPKAG